MAQSTTYLSKTYSGNGNRNKGTISVWCKFADTDASADSTIFGAGNISNDSDCTFLCINPNGFGGTTTRKISFIIRIGGATVYKAESNALLRDVNGWYNIVVRWDTTLGTPNCDIYLNGEEVSYSSNTWSSLSQNTNTYIGSSAHPHYIGRGAYCDAMKNNYYEGSMSHFHYCDGYYYDASSFGSTDSTTGEWKINTSPSVSYGTNGFWFFKDDNALTDHSSNSNSYSLTAGTLTKTEDCPSNVFATLNPLHMDDPTSQYFLSNGNLRQNVTNNDGHRETGFTLHPKGLKGYFEVKCTVDPNFHLGLQNVTSRLLNTNYYTLASPNYYYMQSSNPVKISYANGGSSATHIADYFSQISVGDIIGCAFDFTGTNKNVWFHKNGTYGNNGSGVGNPATGAYPAMTSTQLTADEYEFIVSPNTGSGDGQLDFNFGNGYFATTAVSSAGTNASNNGIFEYDVPAGYTALSTKGLNL